MLKKRLRLPRIRLPRASTIMFVPHSQQSTYSVRIPFGVMMVFFLLVTFAVIMVVYSSIRYLHMTENMNELQALRTVNEQQGRQLRTMEAEVSDMRDKMAELELLEQDVREMLDTEAFLGRPVARREYVQPSRGGGRGSETGERSKIGFLGGGSSFRERKAQWDETYLETSQVTGELLANVDKVHENLTALNYDVAQMKDYLESRPAGFPTAGEISSPFGWRSSPFPGRSEMHPAVDIAADYGAPVTATGKGVVVFAGYRAGYGHTVQIRHNYGFQTVYCHNSAINVQTGQEVARGDLIARVGSSGASTGPHLHYEVLLNGVRVNPAAYMFEPGSAEVE